MPKIVDGVIKPFRSQKRLDEVGISYQKAKRKSNTNGSTTQNSTKRVQRQYQPNLHLYMDSENSFFESRNQSNHFITDEYGQLIVVESISNETDGVSKADINIDAVDPDTEMIEATQVPNHVKERSIPINATKALDNESQLLESVNKRSISFDLPPAILSSTSSRNECNNTNRNEGKKKINKQRQDDNYQTHHKKKKTNAETIDVTLHSHLNDNNVSEESSSVEWSDDEFSDDDDESVEIITSESTKKAANLVGANVSEISNTTENVDCQSQQYYEQQLAPFMLQENNFEGDDSKGENLNTFQSIFADTLDMYKRGDDDIDEMKDFIVPDNVVEMENLPYANFSKAKAIMDAHDPNLFHFKTVIGTKILSKLKNDKLLISKMEKNKSDLVKGLQLISPASEFWLRTCSEGANDAKALYKVINGFENYLELHSSEYSSMDHLETKFFEIWKSKFTRSYQSIKNEVWQSLVKELGKHL